MPTHTDPEVHNIIIAANIFVKRDGKLLVIRRSPQKTYLPNYVQPVGGKVQLNEGPLQAAERELLEEAGLIVRNIRLEAVITDIHSEDMHNWQAYYFSGEYISGGITPDIDEGELLWLTPEEIKREQTIQVVRLIVDNMASPEPSVIFAELEWGEDNQTAIRNLSRTAQ